MRDHLFLHYGWFLQNPGKDLIQTNMYTTENCVNCFNQMKPHANGPIGLIIWNSIIHFQWSVSLVFASWICVNAYGFNFSIPPNEMALYPNWLLLYVLRIIIPMLMSAIVAFKILIKSGRDIQREFDIDLTSSLSHIYSVFSETRTTLKKIYFDLSTFLI